MLAQEITNGHAARMRYSRFRAAMLGLEPQRRNRTNQDRSRVSKKKKGDSTKPKKEEDGGSSGNAGGKVKSEGAAGDTANIKSERRETLAQQPPQPSQPPAPMMPTTAMVKTEPGLAHYSQQHHALLSAAPPRIKQEQPGMPMPTTSTSTSNNNNNNTTATMTPPPVPETPPFGGAAATTGPTSPVAYADVHPRMQMRLLTPCSDSDVMQGFVPQSPSGSDLLQHAHHPGHRAMTAVPAAASPPPSATSVSSPFDFPQPQCRDVGVAPWHPQPPHQQHIQFGHGHHSQGSASIYSAGFAAAAGSGYALDGGYAAFCGEHGHQHHQPHLHQHQHKYREEDGNVADELGLHNHPHHHHHHHHHHPDAAAASMFRERELELEMDPASSLAGNQLVKHEEWEAEGFDGI